MLTLTLDWDGTAKGLPEHRMSLDTWMEALKLLQRCVRRKATNMLNEQVGTDRGAGGGRQSKPAESIDLQIESVSDGCTMVHLVVADAIPQRELFGDLVPRAVKAVVDDIRDEASGRPRNTLARKFLATVPEAVSRQRMTARFNGQVIAEADISDVCVVDPSIDLPSLTNGIVSVTGVQFDPPAVWLRGFDGSKVVKCAADADGVEVAIGLRNRSELHACVVTVRNRSRLLWLRQRAPEVRPRDEIRDDIEAAWPETLRILGS